MDERTQEALKDRLNRILKYLGNKSISDAEYETSLLLKEVKQGFVAPF